MPRHLADWVESFLEYTDNSESPVLYREWVAVSVIAAALQRKVWLKWERSLYPNLFIVLVGPAGKTRKGTALGKGEYFLDRVGIRRSSSALSRQALIAELRESGGVDINEEEGILDAHCSLTVFSHELTVFLGYNDKEFMSDLCDLYDCRDDWSYRTISRGKEHINNVYLNLIGATTPRLIQSSLPTESIGSGLTSRIIFVYADKLHKLVIFPFMNEKVDDIEDLQDKLSVDLNDIHMIKGQYQYTEDFLNAWADWYVAHHNNPKFTHETMTSYNSRRPTTILKLCMILSASRNSSKIIDKSVLERSIDMLNRVEVDMHRVFSGVGTSTLASVMSDIKRHIELKDKVMVKDLLAAHYQNLEYGERTLESILSTFQSMGFCLVYMHNGQQYVRKR